MPLRTFPAARFFKTENPGPIPVPKTDPALAHDRPERSLARPYARPKVRGVLRTGLLLATSAAFGGIAVAIWNRRILAQMRQQSDASAHTDE